MQRTRPKSNSFYYAFVLVNVKNFAIFYLVPKKGKNMFALRFLSKDKFDSYDDYRENAVPHVPDNFNFAYDVIDVLATEDPDKVALLWTNDLGEKRRLLFVIYH